MQQWIFFFGLINIPNLEFQISPRYKLANITFSFTWSQQKPCNAVLVWDGGCLKLLLNLNVTFNIVKQQNSYWQDTALNF